MQISSALTHLMDVLLYVQIDVTFKIDERVI